jgi:hypothetical protein
MKAAIVPQAGRAPVYGDFDEPAPVAGESRVVVNAAALSPVVKLVPRELTLGPLAVSSCPPMGQS